MHKAHSPGTHEDAFLLLSSTIRTEEELFLAISRTFQLMRKRAEKAIAPTGLTLAEYNIIRIIETVPQVTASHIQEVLFATAPSIANLMASLERKQLIQRVAHEKDGRKQVVALTEKGMALVHEGQRLITELSAALKLSPMWFMTTVKNLSTFNDALSRLP